MACHCFAQINVLSPRPPQMLSTHLAAAYCFFSLFGGFHGIWDSLNCTPSSFFQSSMCSRL
jgi:hypothetical protein